MEESIKYCHTEESDEKSFLFDHVHIFWNEQITYHQADDWELSYIITGSGTRVLGDQVELFSSGEIILLPPRMPHVWYFNKNDHDKTGRIENITIFFTSALIDKLTRNFPETVDCVVQFQSLKQAMSFQGNTLKKLQQKMKEMTRQNNMERLASFLHILSVVASSSETRVVGNFNKKDKIVSKMQDVSRFIVHNYQRRITLDEVAKYIGMNRSTFCTFFKREKGKPFFTALNDYRIDCACLMLRQTSMPVAEICYAVGFDDIPYFNRTFKKTKGQTPKYYRALAKEEQGVPNIV